MAEVIDRWKQERGPELQLELFDKNPGPWTLDDEDWQRQQEQAARQAGR